MHDSKPLLLLMNSSQEYGERVAARVAEQIIPHEEREFEDGEHKIRPLASVRNRNVFVIGSFCAGRGERGGPIRTRQRQQSIQSTESNGRSAVAGERDGDLVVRFTARARIAGSPHGV